MKQYTMLPNGMYEIPIEDVKALQAENERYRKALEEIADVHHMDLIKQKLVRNKQAQIAQQALSGNT